MIKGNRVVIKQGGQTYSGVIISFANWGDTGSDDRYIEFNHDEKSDGKGYGYLKESLDKPDSIEIYCVKHNEKFEEDFEHMFCVSCGEEYQDGELKGVR